MVDESPVNTLLQNYGPFAGWFLVARVRAYVCVCVCQMKISPLDTPEISLVRRISQRIFIALRIGSNIRKVFRWTLGNRDHSGFHSHRMTTFVEFHLLYFACTQNFCLIFFLLFLCLAQFLLSDLAAGSFKSPESATALLLQRQLFNYTFVAFRSIWKLSLFFFLPFFQRPVFRFPWNVCRIARKRRATILRP